jgi:hypothetical protein
MRIRHAAAFLAILVLAAGCSSSNDKVGPTDPTAGNGAPPPPPAGVGSFKALFNKTYGVFPYPTDLYFAGSTDGTLNLPASIQPFVPNFTGLNRLDGYSTSSPMTARFSSAIDPASISPASVIVLEVDVDNQTKATVGVRRPLVFGDDYEARVATTVDSLGATLEIVPLKPLTPSSGATNVGYLVILTSALKDKSGSAATPDSFYQNIKGSLPTCAAFTDPSEYGICLLTGAHLQIAGAVGVPPANVVLTFSFSTQSVGDSIRILTLLTPPQAISAASLGVTVEEFTGGLIPGPNSDLYAGEFSLPYYLSPPTPANPAGPLTVRWQSAVPSPIDSTGSSFEITRFNPVPKANTVQTVPLLIGVPNPGSPAYGAGKPAAGWPTVVFLPGFTRARTDMLAVANSYANAGFVVVSMDHPLHGVVNTANPIYVPQDPATGRGERTFDVDYVDNTTLFPPADGLIDPSGANAFSLMLANPIVFRDVVRESALDFAILVKSLPALDLDGDSVPDIDPDRIHLGAHSGGSIVGGITSAQNIALNSAYLNAAGGKYVYQFFDSTRYGPIFQGALAAKGIQKGTTLYESFLRDVQTIVDPSDPFNYIAAAAAARPVVLAVVKDDANVTNTSSFLLVEAAGLEKASAAGPTLVAAGAGRWMFFLEGAHGSFLGEPFGPPTLEMQLNAVSLPASGGGAFQIANSALLEP